MWLQAYESHVEVTQVKLLSVFVAYSGISAAGWFGRNNRRLQLNWHFYRAGEIYSALAKPFRNFVKGKCHFALVRPFSDVLAAQVLGRGDLALLGSGMA
jgi:hypothetical protein